MFSTADYLNNCNMFGIRLGLDATKELLKRAGNPEKYLKFIHLAGTNGKGSTAAMLEHAFRSAGFSTGLYTSPHLIDVRERFRVNGRAVPEEIFNTLGEELAKAAEGGVQIILETHSDHILNGIRLSVKKGVIDRNNIRLNYFYQKEDSNAALGEIVTHKKCSPIILEDGSLSDWPEGFFDEWDKALDELF